MLKKLRRLFIVPLAISFFAGGIFVPVDWLGKNLLSRNTLVRQLALQACPEQSQSPNCYTATPKPTSVPPKDPPTSAPATQAPSNIGGTTGGNPGSPGEPSSADMTRKSQRETEAAMLFRASTLPAEPTASGVPTSEMANGQAGPIDTPTPTTTQITDPPPTQTPSVDFTFIFITVIVLLVIGFFVLKLRR
jgi:hypothetical protein